MTDALAVFEKIERAAKTLRKMPPVAVKEKFCNWPEIIRSFYECYGWNDPDPPRLRPTAKQISEMDQVILWMAWLTQHPGFGKKYTMVIWARACRVPWKKIGAKAGYSDRACREWFRLGIYGLVHAAHKGIIK